jgi:hypothetical protein
VLLSACIKFAAALSIASLALRLLPPLNHLFSSPPNPSEISVRFTQAIDVVVVDDDIMTVPSLEAVQDAINRAAIVVLGSTKTIWDWAPLWPSGHPTSTATILQSGMSDLRASESASGRRPFFDRIGSDIDIVRAVLLLTGSIHGTRGEIDEFITSIQPCVTIHVTLGSETTPASVKATPCPLLPRHRLNC